MIRKAALLLLAIGPVALPAEGAHEWRGAWAGLYPFAVAETRAMILADSARAVVGYSLPYEIPGIRFQRAHLRDRGGRWEMHGAVLEAPAYREWHLGGAGRFRMGRQVRLLVGARCFAAAVGAEDSAIHPALSVILTARSRVFELEAGIVDASWSEERVVAPVILSRAILSHDGRRLLLERTVSPGGGSETTLLLHLEHGALALTQGYRLGVGEASVALTMHTRRVGVTLGQRWHPVLGWTPRVTLLWLRGGALP